MLCQSIKVRHIPPSPIPPNFFKVLPSWGISLIKINFTFKYLTICLIGIHPELSQSREKLPWVLIMKHDIVKSGWPSGLRRCVQVAVHFCGRGFESHFWQTILFNLFRNLISIWANHSRVAQWKRAGPITQRSVDRNYALLIIFQYLSKKCKSKCLIFYSLDQFCQDGRVV